MSPIHVNCYPKHRKFLQGKHILFLCQSALKIYPDWTLYQAGRTLTLSAKHSCIYHCPSSNCTNPGTVAQKLKADRTSTHCLGKNLCLITADWLGPKRINPGIVVKNWTSELAGKDEVLRHEFSEWAVSIFALLSVSSKTFLIGRGKRVAASQTRRKLSQLRAKNSHAGLRNLD